jgi:hypothetical protein
MKRFIILLILIFSVQLCAQVTGSTQTGRLIPKKDKTPQQTDYTPVDNTPATYTAPKIFLLEPNLSGKNEIKYDETSITVRGSVKDEYGLKSVMIGNIYATLLQDNNFFANVPLHSGVNEIKIEAMNMMGVKSLMSFNVVSTLDVYGPTLMILEPTVSRGIKVIRKSEVTTIRGLASDVSGIAEVKVNNQKAALEPNGEFKIDYYLKMGDNRIVVEAFDSKYNSTIDTFIVTRKLEDIITVGKYYALVIGINSYQGYWRPLKNAVNDAFSVAEILENEYHFDEVHTILDKDATRRKIIEKFEWLTQNITPDDNLLVFYAGHGQFNKALNKGYWVPVDAKTNSIADYISNNDVKTFLGGIPSKHTLLITDACFAGDIFRGPNTESIPFDPNNMTKYYREVYRKQSRLALTSGGVEEVMDAGKDNHSIFTYYLLKALKDNDKKYLDASQLFNEFRMAVTNNSEQTPMLQVVRDTSDEGGMFIFVKKDEE